MAKFLGRGKLAQEEDNWSAQQAKTDKWAAQVMTHTDLERQTKESQQFDEVFGLSETNENELGTTLRTRSILVPPSSAHGPKIANILQPALLPMRIALQLLGVVPYTVRDGQYLMIWKSFPVIHVGINALYLTALVVTTVVGMVYTFTSPTPAQQTPEEVSIFGIKLLVVVLIIGKLSNNSFQ